MARSLVGPLLLARVAHAQEYTESPIATNQAAIPSGRPFSEEHQHPLPHPSLGLRSPTTQKNLEQKKKMKREAKIEDISANIEEELEELYYSKACAKDKRSMKTLMDSLVHAQLAEAAMGTQDEEALDRGISRFVMYMMGADQFTDTYLSHIRGISDEDCEEKVMTTLKGLLEKFLMKPNYDMIDKSTKAVSPANCNHFDETATWMDEVMKFTQVPIKTFVQKQNFHGFKYMQSTLLHELVALFKENAAFAHLRHNRGDVADGQSVQFVYACIDGLLREAEIQMTNMLSIRDHGPRPGTRSKEEKAAHLKMLEKTVQLSNKVKRTLSPAAKDEKDRTPAEKKAARIQKLKKLRGEITPEQFEEAFHIYMGEQKEDLPPPDKSEQENEATVGFVPDDL